MRPLCTSLLRLAREHRLRAQLRARYGERVTAWRELTHAAAAWDARSALIGHQTSKGERQ